jgi:hypothetical protein
MLADFLLPKYDKESAIVPQGAARWLENSDVAAVPCRPINADVPRISALAQADGKVNAVTANGFMIRDKHMTVSIVS